LEEQAQEAAWESMQQEHDEALERTEKSNAAIALVF
jgi:hypothetical protein